MGSSVRCDCCGATGRRRGFYPAPEDWYYIQSVDEDAAAGDPMGIYYVYACSLACVLNIWKTGPGPSFQDEAIAYDRQQQKGIHGPS